eukprot:NODE_854_length_3699_cov_0.222500.p1 type:complete len:586 gc:universal NODE_854_length_3699_cov_0.222500:316-2073(+)
MFVKTVHSIRIRSSKQMELDLSKEPFSKIVDNNGNRLSLYVGTFIGASCEDSLGLLNVQLRLNLPFRYNAVRTAGGERLKPEDLLQVNQKYYLEKEDTPAFPKLGIRVMDSTGKTNINSEVYYGVKITAVDSAIGILDEFKLECLQNIAPGLWGLVQNHQREEQLLSWNNEQGIQTYAILALNDCLQYAGLRSSLTLLRENSLSVNQIMGRARRSDSAILVKDTSAIVGVMEVKIPGYNMDNIDQTVDYMVALRNSFNVRYVFGILTTYEKWRILWFEDTNAAASATSKAVYDELCMDGSANEYCIDSEVTVCKSKIYRSSDLELIECLASLLYKMSKSPIYTPNRFIDAHSRYVFTTPKSFTYKKLPNSLECFHYSMPPVNTRNYFILSHFHRGGDGRVALVSSMSGHLGVVKFLNDMGDMHKMLGEEANHWETLWNVDCRIISMNGQMGLLMPFCMTFNEKAPKSHPFSSLGHWNQMFSSSSYDLMNSELEQCMNLVELQKYQNNPLKAAEEALGSMAEMSMVQKDLEWRHVALLPQYNKTTELYDFRPILIDLTRVVRSPDALNVAQKGYEDLKNKINNFKY